MMMEIESDTHKDPIIGIQRDAQIAESLVKRDKTLRESQVGCWCHVPSVFPDMYIVLIS